MKKIYLLILLSLFTSLSCAFVISHDLVVEINPSGQSIKATDSLTIPASNKFMFYLNKKLTVNALGSLYTHKVIPTSDIFNKHIISSKIIFNKLTLLYSGILNDKISGEFSPGNISSKGVSLLSSTYWYPIVKNSFVTYSLKVEHPIHWAVASGGVETLNTKSTSTWKTNKKQDDIYLISYPFKKYERKNNQLHSAVYLREENDELAKKYLNFTDHYISQYSNLIGEYPYEKFFILENYWETGYGMPSFTLLGPSVIKLPFLIYTSFPHEILHNWWGNSVYVDYEKGNWAEGLTTYMADHALQEQRGKGTKSRKNMIKSFMAYANNKLDFPLKDFKSRHDNATRAIGYNKSAMFFHMLKVQLGEDIFYQSLQHFYKHNIWKKASWYDLKKSFQETSKLDLNRVFKQWVNKKGLADLRLKHPLIKSTSNAKYILSFTLEQASEHVYQLHIPIQVTTKNNIISKTLKLSKRSKSFSLILNERPLTLSIDSLNDVFRKLLPGEMVSTINQTFGSDKQLIFVLPSSSKNYQAYKKFAKSIASKISRPYKVIDDSEFNPNTKNKNIWILGSNNSHLKLLNKYTSKRSIDLNSNNVRIKDVNYEHSIYSTFIVAKLANNTLNFLAGPDSEKINRLASKITHYGSYSYLLFEGETNLEKENWQVIDSPFKITF